MSIANYEDKWRKIPGTSFCLLKYPTFFHLDRTKPYYFYFIFFILFNLYAIPYQILTISYQCRQVYGVILVIFFISFVSSLSEVFLKWTENFLDILKLQQHPCIRRVSFTPLNKVPLSEFSYSYAKDYYHLRTW